MVDLSEEGKKAIIRKYLSTPEGREKLAKGMISPKRCPGRDYSIEEFEEMEHSDGCQG